MAWPRVVLEVCVYKVNRNRDSTVACGAPVILGRTHKKRNQELWFSQYNQLYPGMIELAEAGGCHPLPGEVGRQIPSEPWSQHRLGPAALSWCEVWVQRVHQVGLKYGGWDICWLRTKPVIGTVWLISTKSVWLSTSWRPGHPKSKQITLTHKTNEISKEIEI